MSLKETREPNSWYFYEMDADFNTIYFGSGVGVPYSNWFDPPLYCKDKHETPSNVKLE